MELRKAAVEMNWPDKELICALEWGFRDFSESTPPVFTFSTQQEKDLLCHAEFAAHIQQGVEAGWLSAPQSHPLSFPFRIIPGSIEPKPAG